MPASKATSLSSLFRATIKTQTKPKSKPKPIAIAKPSSSTTVDDNTLNRFIFSLDTSQGKAYSSSSSFVKKSHEESISSYDSENSRSSGMRGWLTNRIASTLIESASDQEKVDVAALLKRELDIPWSPNISHSGISVSCKEVTHEGKQKWFSKSSQVSGFNRLLSMCTDKAGTGSNFGIVGKLGRGTGLKEYNALLKLCIEKARSTNDDEVTREQIHKAFVIFKSIKEHGFQIEVETYGPFLAYLIDMAMVQEFHFFCAIIIDSNSKAVPKLGYYEMLLWIKVDDEEKIQELFNYIVTEERENDSSLRENYLLALCECGKEKELLQIFDIIDIPKFTSMRSVTAISKSLGKFQLEALFEKFLLSLKACDLRAENISNFLCSYAIGNPDLAVKDDVLTFKNLHAKHEVAPSSASYANIIKYCCSLLKVHVALDMVDEMFEEGLTVSIGTINHILHACEGCFNYNLVDRVYSLICHHNLEPNTETLRMMISLCMRIKDVDAAYHILSDLEKMNLMPTTNMYNTVMAGYFREKNSDRALLVRKKMEIANVKPDSRTFSYLIRNCESEKEINKEMLI